MTSTTDGALTNDSNPTSASISTMPMLSEREWEKLIALLREGRLVPVIGPELLRVPHGDNLTARLYDLWGQTLADQRHVQTMPGGDETPLLYRVTNRLSVDPEMPIGEFGGDINDVVCNPTFPMPEPLLQLARIVDFPVYLTTTIDHLLETAVIEGRKSLSRPQVIAFKPGGSEFECDLPSGFKPGASPVIFHLFGRTSDDREAFAATEDALIEFSWALIDHSYSPKNLYDYLRGKTLLLLGCNFPDWLDRFFIHALTRDRGIDVQFVSEYPMAGLYDFLKRKRARPSIMHSPVDFVAELFRRWQQGAPRENHDKDTIKVGAVFISYAREDQAIALKLRKQLEDANIDTWMDESGLEPGAEFKDVIHDNIRNAAFFVALISHSLDLQGSGRLGRFVFREWKWAEDAAEDRRKDDHFLQPVVIDDTPPGADFIDRPYRDLHWASLKEGLLSQEFIDFVKKGIRQFRSESGGGR